MNLKELSDEDLTARLHLLVRAEAESLADVLETLSEFDRRELYQRHSEPSLFTYCVGALGYSEGAAAKRIAVARLSRRLPGLLDVVRAKRIHLAGLHLLAPHLNAANFEELVAEAKGKSKREIELLVARFSPGSKAHKDVIRSLAPVVPVRDEPRDALLEFSSALTATSEGSLHLDTAASSAGPRAPAESRIAFNASAAFVAKLGKAKALLRHKHPTGRLEAVFEEALDAFLAEKDPLRPLGRTSRTARSHARRIPRVVRYKVWKRDGGRCAFVSLEGERCRAQDFLEFDHVKPWALGGRSDDLDNIRLLCRAHNRSAARKTFGDAAVGARPRNGRRG